MDNQKTALTSSGKRSTAWGWLLTIAIVLVGVGLEYPRYEATFASQSQSWLLPSSHSSQSLSSSLSSSSHSSSVSSSSDRVFFVDPDDYTRVYRAKQIADGRACVIRNMPDINYPRGVVLHWTAPMDYVVAAAGSLAKRFTHHPDPVGVAAAWVPVGLGVLYVLCMMAWIGRGYGWGPGWLVGLLLVLSPAYHRTFALGHPDHHALLAFLYVFAVGAWMPRSAGGAAAESPMRISVIVSGLATGLAIWVAPQAMLIWGAILVGLMVACYHCNAGAAKKLFHSSPGPAPRGLKPAALHGIETVSKRTHRTGAESRDATSETPVPQSIFLGFLSHRPNFRSHRLAWNIAVATVVTTAWLIEDWPHLGALSIDKIGIVQLALVLIVFLIPIGPRVGVNNKTLDTRSITSHPKSLQNSPRFLRVVPLILAGSAFVVLLVTQRHRVFEHLSSLAFYRWSESIAELQPLFAHVDGRWSLRVLHDRLGYLPYALLLFWPLFMWSKRVPPAMKGTLGLLAPLLAILTILQRRWLDHYNLAVLPVIVIGLWEGIHRFKNKRFVAGRVMRFVIAAVILGLLSYPPCKYILLRRSEYELELRRPLERTSLVARYIRDYQRRFSSTNHRRRAILCEEGEGPMLLYDTNLPVVAAPYHRAIDGIVEAARFYAERDPLKAREQLDRLGVRYIVMPYRANEQLMQFERIAFGQLQSYDPPDESIDALGRIVSKLHYKQSEVTQTMVFRLIRQSSSPCIAGLELIAKIDEGARGPDGRPIMTGLLYVVQDQSRSSSTSESSALGD